MNRQELKRLLVAAGVPESYYFIVGIDSQATPGKGGGFGELGVVPPEDGQGDWRLVSEERGRLQRDQHYPTEDAACEAAWEELRPTPQTAVRQRSPEEKAQALARSRQAVADYEKSAEQYREGGPDYR